MTDPQFIRNFSIVAHIDHGKSTLADRLLELTGTVSQEEMVAQYLDTMDLEREHGITIKAKAVRLNYKASDGNSYVLNLIDTPGHVDFTYEVSRSLAACEGVLLVVDAAQGVEAQTVANVHLAQENNLEIVPVINKIDLPAASPNRVEKEIQEVLTIKAKPLLISAKTGQGTEAVLERVIEDIPSPQGKAASPLQALIFDSVFNPYRGVIVFVRLYNGQVSKGTKIKMVASGSVAEVEEVGVFQPAMKPTGGLAAGEVGYIIAGIKDIGEMRIGDTVTEAEKLIGKPLPGYQEPKPMVFCGLYPLEGGDYESLREALNKLKLNDPAFVFEPETTTCLGFGFRCGFLGLLHLEIVKERLEREYNLELLVTFPSVAYKVTRKDNTTFLVRSPIDFPAPSEVSLVEEPYVEAVVLVPTSFIGEIYKLIEERRGEFVALQYLSQNRAKVTCLLPLGEILLDFYSQLKSRTKGYASLDYEHKGFKQADLAKLNILLAGEVADALSVIVPKEKAYRRGKELVERLKELIPRQLFEVPIQAAIDGKVIARETVRPLRKDVTAKLYGGDVTRKRKLLEKQKKGKKRMKQLGKVQVPKDVFLEVLKVE